MNVLELLANSAQLKRFLQLAALGAVGVAELISTAEASGLSGPEKRAQVIAACVANAKAFINRGFLPAEALENLEKTAGEVIDTKVRVNNDLGLFDKTTTSKQKKGAGK